jgi:hypothetical protein
MVDETKSLEHVEFETKYRVEDRNLPMFKQIVGELPDDKSFIYVEGPDYYFTYPKWWFEHNPQWDSEGTFGRYRKPSFGLDNGRRQVTFKYKPKDSKNNIQRKELNTDIAQKTEDSIIFEQMNHHCLELNSSIIKNCHIYKLSDATLVFYTVYDTTDGKPKNPDHFVEIEVDEDTIASMTEEQAWAVIVKYEKILEPVGVNPQKRLKKSLFQMYKRSK